MYLLPERFLAPVERLDRGVLGESHDQGADVVVDLGPQVGLAQLAALDSVVQQTSRDQALVESGGIEQVADLDHMLDEASLVRRAALIAMEAARANAQARRSNSESEI